MSSSLRQIVAYVFFGVLTTLVNIGVYYVCAHPLGIGTSISTIVSWLISVAFAYVTNKLWVFGSTSWRWCLLLREVTSFYVCRLLTGVLDLGVMIITVDVLHWNDLLMKFLSNVLVVILNFVASRVLIFKKN